MNQKPIVFLHYVLTRCRGRIEPRILSMWERDFSEKGKIRRKNHFKNRGFIGNR